MMTVIAATGGPELCPFLWLSGTIALCRDECDMPKSMNSVGVNKAVYWNVILGEFTVEVAGRVSDRKRREKIR